MKNNEIIDIHKIIINTIKITPKAWDMNHQHFNCDCHMELTDKTYELISERFGTTLKESEEIVNKYFIITDGQV